jgi:hypothetical protein
MSLLDQLVLLVSTIPLWFTVRIWRSLGPNTPIHAKVSSTAPFWIITLAGIGFYFYRIFREW